jgi:protein SCO1
MKNTKRIWLFLLLFGTPLIFLYTLSKGKNNAKDLPYFGKTEELAKKYKINDFIFYDKDSIAVSSNTTQGKTLIVSTLIPSCPSYCPVLQSQLKFLVYDKLNGRPEFKDLLFISHLIDTTGKEPNLNQFVAEQEDVNPNTWKIVVGADNPIYDFELPTGNVKTRECDGQIACMGGKAYYQMILLIDKDKRIRGMYQGNQTQLIEKMRGDIRKLFIEYKEKEKKPSN